MTIAPLRNLGRFGVNTDVDAFDLPLGTFTFATNARFENDRITRGPIFVTVGTLASQTNPPKYTVSYRTPTGIADLHLAKLDGTVTSYVPGGAETDISAPGWTPSTFTQPYSASFVNDIVYLNRPDRVPWFMLREGTAYATLTNWPSTWRCQALRTFNGQVVAIGVQQGSSNYPTMVAWSDFTVWQAVPITWAAGTTNSAGSNVLSDLGDPLIDGLSLRNAFMLYSQQETWAMQPTGDSSVFAFNRVFKGWGVLSQNCVSEINNSHYVFGYETLWRHDGFTPVDIAVGRVKNFIYQNMDKASANQFFTVAKPRDNEVHFCYRSLDQYCAFPISGVNNYQGCNRAAVYNYKADTWYFYDMPYVTSATYMTPSAAATYASEGSASYTSVGGSYSTYGDASKLVLYYTNYAASALGVTSDVRSFEIPGSVYSTGTPDLIANAPTQLLISEFNLDTLNYSIRGYKVIKTIYPVGRLDPGSLPLTFYLTQSDYPNIPSPTPDAPMTFDGGTSYSLDYMASGRFLGMKVVYADIKNFVLTGLDADILVTGQR